MKSKVLSGIVIVVFFLCLQGLAYTALRPVSEISGFWEYTGLFINAMFISSGVILGARFTIKWWVK